MQFFFHIEEFIDTLLLPSQTQFFLFPTKQQKKKKKKKKVCVWVLAESFNL